METKKKSILVIDDMSENLRIIKTILEDSYTVRLARSGALAKSILSTAVVDLILLDIEMPGQSGLEYIAWLKKNPVTSHIPVIFVSSHAETEVVKQALQFKVEGYIIKPINPKLLRQRVSEVLNK
ncbi:hypothetical protein AGMMS49928_11160 [Spirochaetia bacterium]|nr:hypothetical protein AGMMS49928_11160 [Spirochaetia bacterium]